MSLRLQPSPTPGPSHGTGWGLLLLFVYLYSGVAVLGGGTFVAIAIHRMTGRIPTALASLLGAMLLGVLGLTGFSLATAAAAQRWDVVVLLLLIVALPVALVGSRRHDATQGRLALVAYVGMVWSLPFLLGFGVIAFTGTHGLSPSRAVTGVVAVSIVVSGTLLVDRLALVPVPGQA